MEKLLINTPQNVQIEYQLASLGTRFLALLIDYVLIISYVYLVYYFIAGWIGNVQDQIMRIGTLMFFFLPVMMYHLVLESLLSGQTVGKIVMKTKVVRLDGSRASVYEYFVRWALNLVDIWMMGGVIGLLSIILSKQSQRIGDLAAGTSVISLKPNIALSQTVYEDLVSTYEPSFPEYEIRKLSDRDINIIKQSFQDAVKNNNSEVMCHLVQKISEVTNLSSKGFGYDSFIQQVLKDHYFYHQNA